MKTLRHPPSKELWRFCMERLRDLRGPDTRERELANILGFEHSRAVRWKEGQMYVDRAEYLLRLADALEVEPMLLVGLAAGNVSVDQAHRLVTRAGKGGDDAARKKKGAVVETEDLQFAADASKLDDSRAIVLLVASGGESRGDFVEILGRHGDFGGLIATGVVQGSALAERYRPELVFMDMGSAGHLAFEACRQLSSLTTRSQRKCRVVAATSTMDDANIEKPALMAGAAQVVLFPFTRHVFELELDRLEERMGARKKK